MTIELSNGVRISDHHQHGRTWFQFICEEANKDAYKDEYRQTEENLPRSWKQLLLPLLP